MPVTSEMELTFTQEELTLFTKRFEEGYDLKQDDRYNLWLKMNTETKKATEKKTGKFIALCI